MLRDSPNEVLAGLIFAIMAVLEFPPKLSFSNLSREITTLTSGIVVCAKRQNEGESAA